jgi:hypothetical protein
MDCRVAFCGDGIVDTPERCDGNERCTAQCTVRPLLSTTGGVLSLFGTILFVLLCIAGYVFRTRLKALFTGSTIAAGPTSLDDIPLDELEMPWHNWEK